MSVDLVVCLPRVAMPSPEVWAQAIRDTGFPVELDTSELNGWPACSPVNASPTTLRPSAHDSEAKMVRYTFLVRLLHPLLHAGLSRRLP